MRRKWFATGAAILFAIAAPIFMFIAFSSPCLVLKNADTGNTIASFPLRQGDEFCITFIHSVNKSPVIDVYQIRDGKIYVVRTIYYAFGAGVQTEIEEGQTLSYGPDGAMIVSGFDRQIDNLSYIVGTVSDHTLQIGGDTISLRDLCGKNTTVRFLYGQRLFSIVYPF